MQIGFSAPQGCGKTTLVFALDYLFKTTKRYIGPLQLISCKSVILILTKQICQEVGDSINRRFLLDCKRSGKMYFKIFTSNLNCLDVLSSPFLSFHFFFRLN